jgi:acyl-CoA-binding protein
VTLIRRSVNSARATRAARCADAGEPPRQAGAKANEHPRAAFRRSRRQDQVAAERWPARPSNELKFKLYGLFRQAGDGDAPDEGPSAFDFVGRFKHDAWLGNKGMAKDEAMRQYVAAVVGFARRHGVEI